MAKLRIREAINGNEGEKKKSSVMGRLNCYVSQFNIEEISTFGAQEQGQD